MSASVIAQIVSAAGTVLTALISAAGYYMLIKIYRRMIEDMEHQRTANGRPQVIVTDNYGDLPHVSITIKNTADGAAQNLSFEFFAPVTCSDGHVISDLPYFREGMAFLSPGREVTCYWDDMETLIPHMREGTHRRHKRDHALPGPSRGILRDHVEAKPVHLLEEPLGLPQGHGGSR